MARIIQAISDRYRTPALNLVERVFTEHENAAEGALVRELVEEIRSKRFYLPELEIIAVDDASDEVIGYVMLSRFHLGGRYEDRLLLLTPCAVKTELQRQRISRDMIEFAFAQEEKMGFEAVIVEGNPANYRARGFVTAAEHGVLPGRTVHLPHIACLMIAELKPGVLGTITGTVEYSDYTVLTGH